MVRGGVRFPAPVLNSILYTMKKGIQYTHYCAANVTEIINSIWLANELIKEQDIEEAKKMIEEAKRNAEELMQKIQQLDILNEMKF